MDTHTVDEGSTQDYTATLQDEQGVAIALASLDAIVLTLWEPITEGIVNSRDGQNVKNANNVTIHATTGALTWTLQVLDTTIVQNPPPPVEYHRALFEFTYNTTKKGKHEVRFRIPNKRMVE